MAEKSHHSARIQTKESFLTNLNGARAITLAILVAMLFFIATPAQATQVCHYEWTASGGLSTRSIPFDDRYWGTNDPERDPWSEHLYHRREYGWTAGPGDSLKGGNESCEVSQTFRATANWTATKSCPGGKTVTVSGSAEGTGKTLEEAKENAVKAAEAAKKAAEATLTCEPPPPPPPPPPPTPTPAPCNLSPGKVDSCPGPTGPPPVFVGPLPVHKCSAELFIFHGDMENGNTLSRACEEVDKFKALQEFSQPGNFCGIHGVLLSKTKIAILSRCGNGKEGIWVGTARGEDERFVDWWFYPVPTNNAVAITRGRDENEIILASLLGRFTYRLDQKTNRLLRGENLEGGCLYHSNGIVSTCYNGRSVGIDGRWAEMSGGGPVTASPDGKVYHFFSRDNGTALQEVRVPTPQNRSLSLICSGLPAELTSEKSTAIATTPARGWYVTARNVFKGGVGQVWAVDLKTGTPRLIFGENQFPGDAITGMIPGQFFVQKKPDPPQQ